MSLPFLVLLAILLGASTTLRAQTGTAPMAKESSDVHHDHAAAVRSATLTLRAGAQSVTLTLSELQSMPETSVSVFNAHSKQTESYTGPLVADLLAKVGVLLSEKTQHEVLDSYVLAAGTDGYFVVFSGAELQPGLHKAQTIVAITQAGQPLARNGAFQLIDAADAKPARWVRNLNALTMMPVSAPKP